MGTAVIDWCILKKLIAISVIRVIGANEVNYKQNGIQIEYFIEN